MRNGDERSVARQPARQDPAHQSRRHHPDRQPVLRHGLRRQSRDLGARTAQSVHDRVSAQHRAAVHQRRRRRRPGKRSTRARRAPTTAGRCRKVRRPIPSSRIRFTITATSTARARSRAARSTSPPCSPFPSGVSRRLFLRGLLRWMDPQDSTRSPAPIVAFASGIGSPVDLKVGPDGALYYLARADGLRRADQLLRRRSPRRSRCSPRTGRSRSGSRPRSRWVPAAARRSPTSGDATATRSPGRPARATRVANAAARRTAARFFDVVVSNAFGSATSDAAQLTVTQNSRARGAPSRSRSSGTTYAGGNMINYAGTGNDAEDGVLPAERLHLVGRPSPRRPRRTRTCCRVTRLEERFVHDSRRAARPRPTSSTASICG